MIILIAFIDNNNHIDSSDNNDSDNDNTSNNSNTKSLPLGKGERKNLKLKKPILKQMITAPHTPPPSYPVLTSRKKQLYKRQVQQEIENGEKK